MGRFRPLDEVARDFGVSPATMWRWAKEFGFTRATLPGRGKITHLDPDDVRHKLKPRTKDPKP